MERKLFLRFVNIIIIYGVYINFVVDCLWLVWFKRLGMKFYKCGYNFQVYEDGNVLQRSGYGSDTGALTFH